MAAAYLTLVNDILNQVDSILNNYVKGGYQGLVDYLSAPLGAAIVFFFVCYGVGMSQGWVKGTISNFTISLFKIGVIYFVGMDWGNFSFYVYDLFYNVSSEIGSALLTSSPIKYTSTGEFGINGGLQYVLIEVWSIAATIFENGGTFNVGSWVSGILIGAAGLFFIGFSLLEIIIAKCILSILFVVAPLFIALTLFDATQAFFDRWLGATFGYACLMIFISASLGIVISLDQWILGLYYQTNVESITILDVATAILVTWVCIGIIKRVSVLALSIGGAMGAISADSMFAHTISGFILSSKKNETVLMSNKNPSKDIRKSEQNTHIIKNMMKKMRTATQEFEE